MSSVAHRRPQASRVLVNIASTIVALVAAAWACGLRFNLTSSLPVGLYQLTPGRSVLPGSIVLVCLPEPIAIFAKTRGYLYRGWCADGIEPIGKVVAAMAGDSVAVTEGGIIVNGALVAHTRPSAADSHGRKMPTLRRTPDVVSSDSVWLYSPFSESSFDSRYFGPVATARVVAVVRPLVVISGPTHGTLPGHWW